MLGRLARWLCIWGYDAAYFRGRDRHELLYKSLRDSRIILTRDHLLSAKRAWKIYLVKSEILEEQVKELEKEFGFKFEEKNLFTRCSVCNTPILKIEKEKVRGKVPPYIYETQTDFSYCPKCGRIYWQGTHLKLIMKKISGSGKEDKHDKNGADKRL
jgi:hypothetical protein